MAPPIYVKGGQWTNVEDQILRAAVSKYGLTQWARVASLLPKKTARQAKARWNEYLNPSIKRDEWSLEEDEKLLSLAKLMPNQWRSISPVMGRTPTQCVERYQYLLDRAMGGGAEEEEDDNEDLKLSGPGIETLPALGNAFESLPSRPDMEDMDEDEQEMLSEAKARLANTVGKKAKRKERERMLQENRRITLLEKRRDLKAAGVRMSLESKNKKKRNEFDYNTDIPHEHAPPPGLYDTAEEDSVNDRERLSFQERVKFKGVEPKEEKQKKKVVDTTKKDNKRSRQEISDAAKLFSDAADQDIKRRKLDLPAPGTTESETQQINERISNATQEILRSKDKSAAPVSRRTSESQPIQKSSVRKLQEFIKSMFSTVPAPKNEIALKLPPLADISALANEVPSDEEDAPLAGPPVESKEQLTPYKTSVAIRGLTVPNPRQLKAVPEEFSEIEKSIAQEFQSLIKSDYKQLVDEQFKADAINSLSDDINDMVQERIAEELTQGTPEELPIGQYVLPKSKEATEEALKLLDSLHEAANNMDEQIKESSKQYDQSLSEKYNKIFSLAQELTEETNNEALFTKIASLELEAIGERSYNLHELVESVELAASETRIN
ncbi:hypothetical protein FT663_05094 [Candidozyma haemuli var. vulneris]|uniref:Pre-mRNA-splicing factor CEF1 n=1 Tax=Candidozyma haemuli TaxID=45357 RepID=A0A2V1ASB1_9ASCO|nr:hypothetical protein CXQ85_002414 [[Candida] haemuloni]KAF3985342.1 hypothetical protein FT662_05208 [[Candida] haemuloni var. vulneris]KAF3985937.1 hypothetical protein FT663_05094 [[Candida] haemuloni var. vulneris]PVH20614.1 hypothetical protein CXQ85_002414 [[Candida] haemuloni]